MENFLFLVEGAFSGGAIDIRGRRVNGWGCRDLFEVQRLEKDVVRDGTTVGERNAEFRAVILGRPTLPCVVNVC